MIPGDQGGGGGGYERDNNFVANTLLRRPGSLQMRPRRMPLLGGFQAQHQHVENDPNIDDKN